ncbi:MAG: radical SAM family heme chaperone HemW [Clostridia bacterium]|nr:radical SAM family heme chaperone HemW [Clostridia bacterium]
MRGLYIHIPFCKSKCSYCNFYSFVPDNNQRDSYLNAVLSCIEKWSEKNLSFDTVYFGGGTPSFFGGERIAAILKKSRACFEISPKAQITVECNPSSVDEKLFRELSSAGVNRISMGMQSSVSKERKALSRFSEKEEIETAVKLAKENGISDISIDLMLGIPFQTTESLNESLDFLFSLNITHVSAYMLKIEEGTPLSENTNAFVFPDEDSVCDMYLHTISRLSEKGFFQYEISNFSKPGFESRHNLKYWLCEEYLGIGPSAHSFLFGKRFFYKNNFQSFLSGEEPVFDEEGGSEEEYIMLRLRLNRGLSQKDFKKRFQKSFSPGMISLAKDFSEKGFMSFDGETMKLTSEGFLISNYIISKLIEE